MNIRGANEFSILWLTSSDPYFALDDKAIEDMNISQVLDKLSETISGDLKAYIKKVPSSINTIQYRQDILTDFVHNDTLLDSFKDTLEKCSEIKNMIKFAFESEATLYNLLKRIDEAVKVMMLTEQIYDMLTKSNLKSKGLLQIREFLKDIIRSDIYLNFKDDLQHIKEMDEGVHSIKVGINFDHNLKPIEAIVLSLEDQPFKYSRKLKKVTKIINYGLGEIKSIPRKIFAPDSLALPDSLNNLEKIIAPAMKQLVAFCDQFNSSLLNIYEPIKKEITFYEIGVKIYNQTIHAGFPLSQPKLLDEGKTQIEGLYNINLAYDMLKSHKKDQMVYNDFSIEPKGNIFVLTGANRGGKTTFTQGIGQIYWFAHLGFYIPAKCATIKQIDGLYIHFPNEEMQTVNYGRLGEECQRFSSIFSQMSSKSLLLMNESFDGTSYLESLTIATDVLKAVRLLGASVIFNTHLHELGEKVHEMNHDSDHLPKAMSLVTGSLDHVQSFEIREGVPLGQSYAKDIAIKYGVSYEQLIHFKFLFTNDMLEF